jgi:predicted lipoprotein with Yx(FWY)xxD motif
MKRPLTLVPVLVAVVALAAGCGSSSNHNSGGSSSSGSSASNLYGNAQNAKAAPTPASGGARISAANHGLGTMLVDAQGRTLYLWKADTGMSSACDGACAQGWPPVTTSGAPKAGGGVKASLLGTTKRSDGSTQVTYSGHPLYRFAGDTAAGETSGQNNDGFGAPWFVVAPGGTAITRTA